MRSLWTFLAVTIVPAAMAAEPGPQLKLLTTAEGARPTAWYAPIAFSPDGKLLAWGDHVEGALTEEGKEENVPIRGSVKLWDVDKRKVIATLRDAAGDCDYSVDRVAFRPDGKTLAAVCNEEKVKLWDVATGKEKARLKGNPKGTFLAFSPDGKTIAFANHDNDTVILWDPSTGKEIASLKGLPGAVKGASKYAAFNPDGTLFAAGGGKWSTTGRPGAGAVKLWDVATGRERATLTGAVKLKVSLQQLSYLHKGEGVPRRVLLKIAALNGMEFQTEEDMDEQLTKALKKILDKDQQQKYLKAVLREIGTTCYDGPELVWSLAFSPDGKTLASASVLGTVLLWNVQTGKRMATLQRFNPSGREEDINPAYSVAFSPDGRVLAVGTLRGITLWDVDSREKVVALSRPSATIWSVAFSPDGKTLTSAGSKGVIGPRDRRNGDPTLRLWEWIPPRRRTSDKVTRLGPRSSGAKSR
jgi:WD40 repeat protein